MALLDGVARNLLRMLIEQLVDVPVEVRVGHHDGRRCFLHQCVVLFTTFAAGATSFIKRLRQAQAQAQTLRLRRVLLVQHFMKM